jgi:hypothetical protein
MQYKRTVANIGPHALKEPFPTTPNQASTKNPSTDVTVSLPPHDVTVSLPPHAAADIDDTNADLVTDTSPNAGATRATDSWTLEDDAKLTRAVANTTKKKHGKRSTQDLPR